ncbi:hypothetical protein OSB04_010453 [Centaurea solstitialis]|uniref:WRKY domain-containing protein n=1 Tax=Centaurea solstitialis TaxID=347529 RepID=A0AA38T7L8_9ASTR|nr:hypothetical protein OSB04_010453 [Centaurea solstitialis]
MAKQLRANLNSPQARDFLIHNILSSYDKLLYVLKSADSTGSPTPSLPDSPVSGGSLQSGDLKCQRRQRNGRSTLEYVPMMGFEGKTDDGYNWRKYGQKLILEAIIDAHTERLRIAWQRNKCREPMESQRYLRFHTKGNTPATMAASRQAPSPPSPEKYEIEPPHHYHHHQPSPNPSEMLSDLKANLSVNTTDLGATDAPSFSFTPTPFGILDDCDELVFPNLSMMSSCKAISPSFISPANSASNNFSTGTVCPFMDFPTDPATHSRITNLVTRILSKVAALDNTREL